MTANDVFSLSDIINMVTNGEPLVLAGDEKVLSKVPKGNWIGGTIPYFIGKNGGEFSREKIFVTRIPDFNEGVTFKIYTTDTINNIFVDAPKNGFSIIIIPANSQIHVDFSINSSTYKNYAASPLVGWVSGVSLDEINNTLPKIVHGKSGLFNEEDAIVMHISLPKHKFAEIGILNIFEQGDGDIITVEKDGFEFETVFVNGKKTNFVNYLNKNNINHKLPLIANFMGSPINTCIQEVNENLVVFYGPLFNRIEYKFAKNIPNYIDTFNSKIASLSKNNIAFSCNCILNYLYAELEGKQTGEFTGPITFGEVAYQLLNQTMVYLDIQDR